MVYERRRSYFGLQMIILGERRVYEIMRGREKKDRCNIEDKIKKNRDNYLFFLCIKCDFL
jgi:hypothetical protein